MPCAKRVEPVATMGVVAGGAEITGAEGVTATAADPELGVITTGVLGLDGLGEFAGTGGLVACPATPVAVEATGAEVRPELVVDEADVY